MLPTSQRIRKQWFGVRVFLAATAVMAIVTAYAANPAGRKPDDPPEIDIKGSRFSLPPDTTADKEKSSRLDTAPAAESTRPAKRLPMPEAAAREKALATVREVFKSELEKAKTPAEQIALAEKLLKVAAETKDDPVARLVLWQLVVETATKAGDVKAAFAALDDVAANFEMDELAVKSRTFVTLAPRITTKNFRDTLVLASSLIGRAVGADRYDVAKAVSEQINALAQKLGDPATKKEVAAQLAEVERMAKAYADVPAANKTLETNAVDQPASLIVGKYLMEKGNWDAAMSYLALSGDPLYKDIAAKELAQPKEVAERIAIADGWWALGESDKTPLKTRLLAHAADLYGLALPDATGLTKKKVESRLADAAKIAKSPLEIKAPDEVKKSVAAAPKGFTNKIGMKLILIPAGEFGMGSPDTEQGRHDDEKQHPVRITKPFYMGVYPVTRGQFAKFVAATHYVTEGEMHGSWGGDANGKVSEKAEYTWRNPGMYGNQQTDDHPVVCVNWDDTKAYLDWLIKADGRAYRLPTEAEWEYACRAGTKTVFNFGDVCNGTQANCNGSVPYGPIVQGPFLKRTASVGSYKPNLFGLYDMHGNVFQQCSDWYGKDYGSSPADDPHGPASGKLRAVRGGVWRDPADLCRSAARLSRLPSVRGHDIGFRVACEVSTEPVSKREIAPAPAPLTIVSARWGGGNNWADVTKIAQGGVLKGEWVWATQDYLKADPTPGWRKHLEVTYEKAGVQSKVTIDEGGAFKPKNYQEN